MKKDDKEVVKLILLLAGGLAVGLVFHLCVVYLQ